MPERTAFERLAHVLGLEGYDVTVIEQELAGANEEWGIIDEDGARITVKLVLV